jgi:hypothetical protein
MKPLKSEMRSPTVGEMPLRLVVSIFLKVLHVHIGLSSVFTGDLSSDELSFMGSEVGTSGVQSSHSSGVQGWDTKENMALPKNGLDNSSRWRWVVGIIYDHTLEIWELTKIC